MSKDKVKKILIVLIILLLCLNVGVYAALSAAEVKYTKSSGTTVTVKAALDELYTKAQAVQAPTYEIGDEVTVGGEQFYVLGWDNNCDTVDLIAKYNLNTAGTAQQDAASGTTGCVFSSTNYWSSSFTSSPFNLNDFIGFTETDVLGKAKSYGRSKGALSSRLLSYKEANALATKASSNEKIATMLWGKANSVNGYLLYWLGDAGDQNGIRYVTGDSCKVNIIYSYNSSSCGVRPVITVLKYKIS